MSVGGPVRGARWLAGWAALVLGCADASTPGGQPVGEGEPEAPAVGSSSTDAGRSRHDATRRTPDGTARAPTEATRAAPRATGGPPAAAAKGKGADRTTKPKRARAASPAQCPDFAALFEVVAPSVVGVVGGRTVDGRFLPERSGTGFVWDTEGHVVTSDHLVGAAAEIRVRTHEGRVMRATQVGRDGPTDLLVARVSQPEHLTAARRGGVNRLRPGQWVAALGNPYGMGHSINVGVISAVGRREMPPGGPKYADFIQADLSVNPGSSGGPLVDAEGLVIGLNTATLAESRGMAFATPIDMVELVVGHLLEKGKFRRGFAGLFVNGVPWSVATRAGLERPAGARVSRLVPGGPAERAGLQSGDLILRFGDKAIRDAGALPWLIAASRPGTAVPLEVLRGPERLELVLEITAAGE